MEIPPTINGLKKRQMIFYPVLTCCNPSGTQNSFSKNQEQIYGSPKFCVTRRKNNYFESRKKFEFLIDSHLKYFSESLQVNSIPVSKVKKKIEERVQPIFGSKSPKIIIEDHLSARATASSKRIRLRKGASFTNKDVDQLINHEGLYSCCATTLNGRSPSKCKNTRRKNLSYQQKHRKA